MMTGPTGTGRGQLDIIVSSSEETEKEIIIRVIIGLNYNCCSLSGKLVDYSQQQSDSR